ncbi:DUF983 domain-containing protein [Rhodospirillales bacterium]|nr:DUF983 domain-containing protein [Rhodospirillales bacterium]
MASTVEFTRNTIGTSLWRGAKRSCPNCGKSNLFAGFLKIVPKCANCGLELGHMRADDFPPYITIMVVGHIVVPSFLLCEKLWQPEISTHLAIWLPITGLLTFLTLPRAKGAVVGWMLHLGLRGDETQ